MENVSVNKQIDINPMDHMSLRCINLHPIILSQNINWGIQSHTKGIGPKGKRKHNPGGG